MGKQIDYPADTVGVDGTVYPTVGENIRRNSSILLYKKIIKVIIKIKPNVKLSGDNKELNYGNTVISGNSDIVLLKQILKVQWLFSILFSDGHLSIKVRDSINDSLNGEITLLLGVM